jgi:hypothetical protein
MWGRRVYLLALLLITVFGPLMILTDNDPPWNPSWTQWLMAVLIMVGGVLGIVISSCLCLSGDISENHRKYRRCQIDKESRSD